MTLSTPVIAVIRAYQRIVSPFLGLRCRFAPSCSSYAAEALAVHGVAAGGWLALRRVLRCQPFTAGGYDPVPQRASGAAASTTAAVSTGAPPCQC